MELAGFAHCWVVQAIPYPMGVSFQLTHFS